MHIFISLFNINSLILFLVVEKNQDGLQLFSAGNSRSFSENKTQDKFQENFILQWKN